MQLIDLLEKRADGVRLIENVYGEDISVLLNKDSYSVVINKASYVLSEVALETYLNLIKVPIKMVYRCLDNDGGFIADSLVNFWISQYDSFSFLVEVIDGVPTITQVFSGNGFYLPSVKVNDLIIEFLGGDVEVESFFMEEDVFEAIYLTKREKVAGDGEPYQVGVRVLYSDCFTLTPRFDGILYNQETGAIFSIPTAKRKFRVAGSTIPQILQQIREFIELSIGDMNDKLIPKIEIREDDLWRVFTHNKIKEVCKELRLSQKVVAEICGRVENDKVSFYEAVRIITSAVSSKHTEAITVHVARDIEIALTEWYLGA